MKYGRDKTEQAVVTAKFPLLSRKMKKNWGGREQKIKCNFQEIGRWLKDSGFKIDRNKLITSFT